MTDAVSTPSSSPQLPPLPSKVQDHPLLGRRNSIDASFVVVPGKLSLRAFHRQQNSDSTTATSSSSSDDFDLCSIKRSSHSYTSLKDLLPLAAVNSPRPTMAHQSQSGSEICIRNRLVKQAAWAYLQPMSTSVGSTGTGFFHRVSTFFKFIHRQIVQTLDWLLRVIWVRSSR